jgi:hypothetical protein
VLPIGDKRNPGDDRPRKAIAAALAWCEEPSEANRQAASAAAAASAFAYYAAAAAASAASACAESASAAYASASAYYATAAAIKSEKPWQCSKIREFIKWQPT